MLDGTWLVGYTAQNTAGRERLLGKKCWSFYLTFVYRIYDVSFTVQLKRSCEVAHLLFVI
uniref:Uncharacterized protein n=1 Tax=Anguilla anguilla TaxID=7936 RepID=A0A0E9TAQ5_ANGAN